jgi:hypothetical protein
MRRGRRHDRALYDNATLTSAEWTWQEEDDEWWEPRSKWMRLGRRDSADDAHGKQPELDVRTPRMTTMMTETKMQWMTT